MHVTPTSKTTSRLFINRTVDGIQCNWHCPIHSLHFTLCAPQIIFECIRLIDHLFGYPVSKVSVRIIAAILEIFLKMRKTYRPAMADGSSIFIKWHYTQKCQPHLHTTRLNSGETLSCSMLWLAQSIQGGCSDNRAKPPLQPCEFILNFILR